MQKNKWTKIDSQMFGALFATHNKLWNKFILIGIYVHTNIAKIIAADPVEVATSVCALIIYGFEFANKKKRAISRLSNT